MLGLPIWAIQLIIVILRVTGLLSWAGALSAKLVVALGSKLEKLKTYHNISDFPQAYPGKTNVSNVVTTQPEELG